MCRGLNLEPGVQRYRFTTFHKSLYSLLRLVFEPLIMIPLGCGTLFWSLFGVTVEWNSTQETGLHK
jgi:hypothetical protein